MDEKNDSISEKRRIILAPSVNPADYPFVIENDELPPYLIERERRLNERIIGQEKAVRKVLRAFTVDEAGLSSSEGPVLALLLLGPSGVGKTELAIQLPNIWVDSMHPKPCPLILISCANLKERHAILSIIGAPKSYVGYDDPSPLEAIEDNDAREDVKKAKKDLII